MKKVLMGLVVVVLLVAAGGYWLFANLDGLIKDAVEEYAPQYTQTDVSLGGVSVSLSGEGGLNDLVIGNPKGYKGDQAMSLGELDIALEPKSLTEDVLVIHNLEIVAPAITYEPGGDAGSNLQKLVQNIQKSAGSAGGSAAGGEEGKSKDKKVIIDRLVIRDGNVSVVTPLSEDPLSVGLPTIEFADIGRDKGGEYIPVVIKKIMKKVTDSASKVANVSLDDLKGQLKGKLQDKLKGGLGDKLPEGVGGGDVGKKLQGLFGK